MLDLVGRGETSLNATLAVFTFVFTETFLPGIMTQHL